jgi:hypothetical protein
MLELNKINATTNPIPSLVSLVIYCSPILNMPKTQQSRSKQTLHHLLFLALFCQHIVKFTY